MKNRGKPPRPHRYLSRDEYFDNASTTSQFLHPEGDLREHLKARQIERFKMPHMALYEGKTDPDDHIEIYIGHMNLYGIPEAIQFASMEDLTDREVLMGALSSIRHDIPFREDLNRNSAYSYQEFLKCARGFINTEETGRLAHNEALQVNNPPNNNADLSLRRHNNKRGRDDNNNADNAAEKGQNKSSNPQEDLTSMLSP
ncbi:hypothetical protein TIFTF001_034352 [Ficus carica]|uniref:Uncharacterized protein n=1 Tax=Ficus carica TaxID=3494 RepID=A0AA88E118_FICCA|nr:hypothetical protein TIFTF001_034352 [Ficus carica]